MASEQRDVSKLRLILVQGDNHANEAGEYSRTNDKVRGKFIWVCQSKGRMMFYKGDGWAITATHYMQKVLDGATGCYVHSKDADFPYEADWSPNLEVSEVCQSAKGGQWEPAFKAPYTIIWWSSPTYPEVPSNKVTWFYNEVTVKQTAVASYFCTNGLYPSQSYMGIQDHGRKTNWVIFSVWDKTSLDKNPNAPSDDLVKVLAQGEFVTVERFAHEGTGSKSYLLYDWKVGHTYQLMVNVRPDARESDKVVLTGWFRIPELNIWRLLASFQVRPTAASYRLYSFLEDYKKNGRRRQGLYGPAWVKTEEGPWVQLTHGKGEVQFGDGNNRNVFLTDDRRRLGITTGGPALTNKFLGPYTSCDAHCIPTVLALNPLPDRDGAPARLQ